jgi:hypothetical protein
VPPISLIFAQVADISYSQSKIKLTTNLRAFNQLALSFLVGRFFKLSAEKIKIEQDSSKEISRIVFMKSCQLKGTSSIIVLKPGPARRVNSGPGSSGAGTEFIKK